MCSIWEGWKLIIIINFHFTFYSLNWVKAEGHKYRKPCVLLADMDNDDYPIFVQLEEIFSISSRILFLSYSTDHCTILYTLSCLHNHPDITYIFFDPTPLHPRTANVPYIHTYTYMYIRTYIHANATSSCR